MGERGPPPTPVLAIRGSWRANRNPDEPQPERGRPRCPRWLDPQAKEAWGRPSSPRSTAWACSPGSTGTRSPATAACGPDGGRSRTSR